MPFLFDVWEFRFVGERGNCNSCVYRTREVWTVAVELMPKEPGEFAFGCPMGMFRGRLIVE